MKKLPRLLSGQSMTEAAQLHPMAMGLTMNAEPLSTATMTLCASDAEVAVKDWVRIYKPNGKDAGVFRVSSIKTNYTDDGMRDLTLEHGMATLRDTVLYGEYEPKDMGGSEESVSIVSAISFLLSHQNLWRLGRCDFDTSQGWKFSNTTLYNALTTLTSSIMDYEWTFDMQTLPWTLNLVRRETSASREMRLARNIATMNVTVDSRDMYTRLYPIGHAKLDITSVNSGVPYLEKNVETWGLIEATDTDQGITSASLLKAHGQTLLDRYSVPLVTVTINGFDLSLATGWDVDSLDTGMVCRVPLPQFDTTLTERITTVQWADMAADPYAVTVTLANPRPKLTDILNEKLEKAESTSRAYGAGAAKLSELDETTRQKWTEIQQDEAHISLIATELGLEKTDTGELRVTANSISQIVQSLGYEDFGTLIREVKAGTNVTVDPKDIEAAVKGYIDGSVLSKYLTVDAASEMYVTEKDVRAVVGAYVVKNDKGQEKSIVQILADQFAVESALSDINGALSVSGTLSLKKDLLDASGRTVIGASGNVYGKSLYAADSFYLGDKQYTPKEITVVTDFTQALGEASPAQQRVILAKVSEPPESPDVLPGQTVTF